MVTASLTEASQPPAMAEEISYPTRQDPPSFVVASPLHLSDTAEFAVDLTAFHRGLGELGVGRGKKQIQPQQNVMGSVLEARYADGSLVYPIVSCLVPRRASKTTSIFGVAIGRALAEPNLNIGISAQSGTKARERFLQDIVRPLEQTYRDKEMPHKINRGRGSERVVFSNGSQIQVLPPLPDSWRGDAFDLVIFDEAQALEPDPDFVEELLAAVLPTMDTTGGQFILAGTAGKARAGLFWDTLQKGVRGEDGYGVIWYGAPDDTDPENFKDPAVVAAAHPGIGTLTTLAAVMRNAAGSSPAAFSREYLSIFGREGTVEMFFDMDKWDTFADPGTLPDLPTDRAVGLAITVHPDQSCAAISAAWRDDDGRGCLLLVDYRPGTKWLGARAKELSDKLRTNIVHDEKGPVMVQVEAMERMRPRPRLTLQKWGDVQASAALMKSEFDAGNVRHWNQPDLNDAVRLVTRRESVTTKGWAFGRTEWDDSIIAAEGASLALRWADQNPKRKRAAAFSA